MKKIVVFGSINTDLTICSPYIPNVGETLKGSDFHISQGGKGANQAVAASKLGGDVQMIGCIGNDLFGRDSLVSLKNNKVGSTYVKILNNVKSSIAIIIRIDNDNRIILDSTANELLKAEDLKTYMKKHKVEDSIFIAQLENNPNEVYKALEIAKMSNMLTIFNPAPAIKVPHEIFNWVDILVVNQTENEILTNIYPNNPEDCLASFDLLKRQGLKSLIITLGSKGSFVINLEKHEIIEGVEVDSVDSTGAGDAYIGALAYCLSQGKDIFASCKFASYVASLCVLKKGAQESLPTLEEVENFIRSKNYEF